MKKVLFYTDTPLIGGTEHHMALLAKYLPKDKYEVTLACSTYSRLNGWCQQFMSEGVSVMRIPVLHKHDPRHYLYLKKIIPEFDLIHLHLWNPGSCRYAYAACGNKPIVVTEHDPFILKGLKGWIKGLCNKKVKAVIAASEASKEQILGQDKKLDKKIHLIFNGIDTKQWIENSKLENRDEARVEYYSAGTNSCVLLCVAELHERKGQRFLIEAFEKLAGSYPHLKLAFVGAGAEEIAYKKLALKYQDRILFLGQMRNIASLMSAADIFVLPSRREAFGLVLLEAACAKLPIVASNVGGIREVVTDGVTGTLVEPENSEALANALAGIFQNYDRAVEMAEHAFNKVTSEFDARIMAEKTAAVYDSVLQGS